MSAPADIVVVARDEGPELLETVRALKATLPSDTRIVVVDDGSTDGSAAALDGELVRVLRPPITWELPTRATTARRLATRCRGVLRRPCPARFADGGRRCGIRRAPGGRRRGAGASPDGRPALSRLGLTFVDAALNVDWLPAPANGSPEPMPMLCGCFMAVRREALHSVGCFDSGMSYYGSEDLDSISLGGTVAVRRCPAGRGRAPFPRSPAGPGSPVRLHNLLRMASIHTRAARPCVRGGSRRGSAGFAAALAAIAASNAGSMRERINAKAVHDTRWCAERFGMRVFEQRSYEHVNRHAWSYSARAGSSSSQPVDDAARGRARVSRSVRMAAMEDIENVPMCRRGRRPAGAAVRRARAAGHPA